MGKTKSLIKFLSLLSLFIITTIFSEEQIRVLLSTEESLSPIYLGNIQQKDSSFNSSYLNELRAILERDFSYNGFSKILPVDQAKEEILAQEDNNKAFNISLWQGSRADFILKCLLREGKLYLMSFSPSLRVLKHFKEVSLSGDIAQDRKSIHKLSDTVQKTLFKVDGIARHSILYSLHLPPKTKDQKWSAEIWECDWDGKNPRQLTKENSYCITPSSVITRNCEKTNEFLYVSYKNGQPKIHLGARSHKISDAFITLRGNQLLPAISPNRDKIAFICDASGKTDLFIQSITPNMQKIDKPVQIFSYPKSVQASPTFSPDGQKIAFVSNKDGSPKIYTIPAKRALKRAEPTLLTAKNRDNTCPSWSPDGKKLAYSAKTEDVRQIWIYDFDTNEERQLTYGSGNKENPVWAPDSLHLVFNSADATSSELYVVNLKQSEPIKITSGSGKKHYPTWAIN